VIQTSIENYEYADGHSGPSYLLEADKRSISPLVVFLVPFTIAAVAVGMVEGFTQIETGLGAILTFAYLVYLAMGKLAIPKELFVFIIFFVWSALTIFVTTSIQIFLPGLFTVFQILLMVFITINAAKNLKTAHVLLMSALIGCLIVAASAYLTGDYARAEVGEERVAGLAMNANTFGMIVVYAIALLLYLFGCWKSWLLKAGCLVVMAGMIKMAIASGSREAFVSVLFLMVLWFCFTYTKTILRQPLTFIVMAILLAGFLWLLMFSLRGSMLEQRLEQTKSERGYERWVLYLAGFKLIAQHPVMGVSWNHYQLLSGHGAYAHSNYIELAAATGIPGALMYYSMFVILWRRLWRLGKMPQDFKSMAIINLGKALILVRLLGDFTRVSYYSKLSWIVFAVIIGWSYQHELYCAEQMAALASLDDASDNDLEVE
jgi:O-antigen ligase